MATQSARVSDLAIGYTELVLDFLQRHSGA